MVHKLHILSTASCRKNCCVQFWDSWLFLSDDSETLEKLHVGSTAHLSSLYSYYRHVLSYYSVYVWDPLWLLRMLDCFILVEMVGRNRMLASMQQMQLLVNCSIRLCTCQPPFYYHRLCKSSLTESETSTRVLFFFDPLVCIIVLHMLYPWIRVATYQKLPTFAVLMYHIVVEHHHS